MPNRFLIFLPVLLFVMPLSAQPKLSHWGEIRTQYVPAITAPDENRTADLSLSNLLVVPYRILISDVDGDHCPFTPTCSAFFVEACRQTNIFQGTLMFVDRFTRDSNTLDRSIHYMGDTKRNKLIDPVSNYRLHDSLIIVGPQK